MSWDVMVFRFAGSTPTMSQFEDGSVSPIPLGPATQVRDTISRVLPDVDWSDPSWGLYGGDGFSIEFNAGDDDPIENIMLHVRGGGDAIAAMMAFAVPNGWSLLDCSTSEFLNPDNPSQEGWEGFQRFRDKVVRRSNPPADQ